MPDTTLKLKIKIEGDGSLKEVEMSALILSRIITIKPALLKSSAFTSSFFRLPSSVIFTLNSTVPVDIYRKFYIFASMKILLLILCIVLVALCWPYIIALPIAIVKAFSLIVSGRDNDPEWSKMKESKMRDHAAKAEARRKKRRDFWLPSSFR